MTFTFIRLSFECAKLGKAGIHQRFRKVLTSVFITYRAQELMGQSNDEVQANQVFRKPRLCGFVVMNTCIFCRTKPLSVSFFFSKKLYAYSIGYIIAYAKQKCTLIIIAKYNNVYIYIYI